MGEVFYSFTGRRDNILDLVFFQFGNVLLYNGGGYYARFFLVPGIIIIITTFIIGINAYSKSTPRLEVKKNYMNVKWLNHQHYELGKSLQDLANDQGVSMMTIKKWVDKLDDGSADIDAKEW